MLDYKNYVKDLSSLIAFKSTAGKAEKDMPFGAPAAGALNCFLQTARSLGFETVNYDNYAGEVTYGQGKEIGIIGHLDVVPAGDGWSSDPFTLTERGGALFGRGVADDKGPMLLCLYALKELKESGITPSVKFRLFAGCNEETGWKDVEYLSKVTALPELGFSPDGNFPLSYAEKGVCVATFCIPLLKKFRNLKGGTAVNAVCAYACAEAADGGIDPALIEKHGLKLNGNLIESFGKAAHGSAPHLGKNAMLPLFEYFADAGEDVHEVIDCLFKDKYGLTSMKNEQGSITFSPDLLSERRENAVTPAGGKAAANSLPGGEGYIEITCDCRIPAPFTVKEAGDVMQKFGIPFSYTEKHPPVMVDKEGDFAAALLNAYNGVTGETAKAESLCGSTFARAFKKGCAFGPEFPGKNCRIHDADENMEVSDLFKAYEIYKTALFTLAKQG